MLIGIGIGLVFSRGSGGASYAAPTAPVLTKTSTGGGIPIAFDATMSDMIADPWDTDDILCRWRINGGAWTDETPVSFSESFYLTYGYDAGSYAWPGITAYTWVGGETFGVQVGVRRPGHADLYSTELSQVMDSLGWTPDGMWLASEPGDWWDVDDMSSMFQDTGATTVVTAVGQTVKAWVGQRGNITLTNATGVILQNDGTRNYLDFVSASGNQLTNSSCQTVNATDGSWTVSTGATIPNLTGARYLVTSDDGTTRTHRAVQIAATTGVAQGIAFTSGGSSGTDSGGTLSASTLHSLISVRTTTTVEMFLDNTSGGSTAASAGKLTANLFNINNYSSTLSTWRLYGGVVAIGRAIDSTERGELHTWTVA